MKIKIYSIVFITVAVTFFLGFTNSNVHSSSSKLLGDKHPDVDWTIGCVDCHQETTPEIFTAWSNSKHGTSGFGCYICHGDGQEVFYKKGQDNTCLGCHSEKEVNYKNLKVKSCFDCHNGHTLKFHNKGE